MEPVTSAVSLEKVAAITAAIAMMIDQPVGSFVVTSITPERPATAGPAPSVWAKAGLIENHLARRSFGIRSR